jgi:hypothetical protein
VLVGPVHPSYGPAMRRSLGVAVATLSLVLLVGCSGLGSTSGSADSGTGSGAAVAPGGSPSAPDSDANRQVVTTATASVTVKDPAAGAQRVSQLVETAGGRVDERTEQVGSGRDGVEGAAADLVVRVPAAALSKLLADLEDVGDVANVSVSRSDMTTKAVDLDARISALQTSVARLQALMGQAASTADLLAAEKALSERQESLESLQSQRALLADQVELSTLTVHLVPVGVAPPGGPDGFLEGLGTGWRALVTTLSAAVVVLGILLPWLAVAGLLAAAVLTSVRFVRRRMAVVAPAPPAPPQG